jgi:hypothetical protein
MDIKQQNDFTAPSSFIKTDTSGNIISVHRNESAPAWYYADHTYLDDGTLILLTGTFVSFELSKVDNNFNFQTRNVVADYLLSSGGIITNGKDIFMTLCNGVRNRKVRLLKIDSQFNLSWEKDFISDGNNDAESFYRTNDNGMLMSGFNVNDNTIYLIKLDSEGNFEPYLSKKCGMAYPNPANGMIHIEHPSITGSDVSFIVYDLQGRVIMNFTTIKSEEDIDISNLDNGMYIYKLYDSKGYYCTGKFIKR